MTDKTIRYTLMIDTTIAGIHVGIASEEQGTHNLINHGAHLKTMDSARALPILVDALCHSAQVALADVSRIVVGTGPGSFTGIKLGNAFCAGIAMDSGKQIAACNTLSCLLNYVTKQETNLLERSKTALVLPQTKRIGFAVSSHQPNKVAILDLGDSDIDSTLKELGQLIVVVPWSTNPVIDAIKNAPVLAELGSKVIMAMFQQLANGQFQFRGSLPAPNYMRKSSPEEALQQKQGS